MCAFNPRFLQGATTQQIRQAMDYASHLITPEQEQELRQDKAVDIKVETDWKQLIESKVDEVPNVSNQVVYPAGPVGVPRECPSPRRITGTNGPNN